MTRYICLKCFKLLSSKRKRDHCIACMSRRIRRLEWKLKDIAAHMGVSVSVAQRVCEASREKEERDLRLASKQTTKE